MVGIFAGDWPPTATTTDMNMTDWELTVENQGAEVQSVSCIGAGGQSVEDDFDVVISVTRLGE
jgi:hypothetical protein